MVGAASWEISCSYSTILIVIVSIRVEELPTMDSAAFVTSYNLTSGDEGEEAGEKGATILIPTPIL